MGKIVITGASGQYGRMATDKLIAKGHAADLILITRTPSKLAEREAEGCDVRYGDFDKPETLADAVKGAEKMLLISGTRVGARIPQHKAAIGAAAANGVKHIIYTSFVNVDEANPAIVAIDHRETENLVKASGLAWTFLRDAHYADAMILNAGPGFIASGTWLTSTKGGREAMVWREDCVDCAVAVLTQDGHENKAYPITGPNSETFEEVAAMLSEACGKEIKLVETDDDGMYAHFDALGIPREPVDDQSVAGIPWNSDDMVSFERAIREGYLDICTDDVEKLTGRKARSVRELIEANAEFLKQVAKDSAA
ncbi:SDR family oxidoreductase [Hyphococcus luteus]|uniref:NAD(P)-dependent oxidoreductase n=1 Tax=Hyphococcus luteus TaxID=2058213 RepID=A0A2S7K0U8_9PROT|nr:SDR family oxidoreductase [Marinicaulis flavus]PQA86081.1 NAD(P)-dependent oxidoreductase [Marinicaulis flavus]